MTFQDLFINQVGEQTETTLPLYKEMAIDFTTGEFVKVEDAKKKGIHGGLRLLTHKQLKTYTHKQIRELSILKKIKVVEGAEALKVWIWRALKTQLNKYRIHSEDYGNELHEELGHVYNRSIKEQLLYEEIRKTLLVNPYILSVSNFSTTFGDETYQNVKISFECVTIYGNILSEREVYNV